MSGPVHFDADALKRTAAHLDAIADSWSQMPSSAHYARQWRERATVIRRAIAAHEALGDRFVNQTAELRATMARLGTSTGALRPMGGIPPMLSRNPIVRILLVLVALVAGSCAFIYEPPLSESYTGIRFDFPTVHLWPALLLALASVLVLAYLITFDFAAQKVEKGTPLASPLMQPRQYAAQRSFAHFWALLKKEQFANGYRAPWRMRVKFALLALIGRVQRVEYTEDGLRAWGWWSTDDVGEWLYITRVDVVTSEARA